eukprot:GHVO01056978.1.p1 GENE.GHVO01056978.1~~GHVO01056978.1.p1  ORF type:complete len:114 (+),score=12.02 GHVO01056978.1:162-503(+)
MDLFLDGQRLVPTHKPFGEADPQCHIGYKEGPPSFEARCRKGHMEGTRIPRKTELVASASSKALTMDLMHRYGQWLVVTHKPFGECHVGYKKGPPSFEARCRKGLSTRRSSIT